MILWALSLDSIDPRRFTDTGMISALPVSFFAALGFLAMSFSLALVRRRVVPLLTLILVSEVLIFFGTASFVEDGPRTQSAWRLVGVSDYITANQTLDRNIDVFFNWPGFFILISFLTRAAGLADAVEIARWAPLFFNLIYALPLAVIFRSLAVDGRQIWLGLWLFFAGNWISQDYLAPQALAYFIYLVIIAILLTVFSNTVHRSLGGWARMGSAARTVTVAFVLLLFALIVPSHQLTPWVVMLSVAGLVILKRLGSYGLPIVMSIMAATWLGFFTGPYLSGHSDTVAGSVGSVGANLDANVGGRFGGSVGHIAILQLRIGFALAIVALAVWGVLRLRRAGAPIATLGVLACAPSLMLGFQSYGGELLLRTYLFALPFLVLAGAAALAPLYAHGRRLAQVVATALLLAASVGFVVTRYGNEKMDFFTKQEVAAMKFAYDTAPLGAQLFAAYPNVPWKFEHYADYAHRSLDEDDVTEPSVTDIISDLQEHSEPAYLVFTRSQFAGGELLENWDPQIRPRLRAALLSSGRFEVLFENRDAIVLGFDLSQSAQEGQ